MNDDDRGQARARREAVYAQLQRHPSLVAMQQLEEMGRAHHWFAQNGADLLSVIDSVNASNMGAAMFMEGDAALVGGPFQEFVTDLGLRWHNYVAAAKTVEDHMFHIFEEQPDDLKAEYEERKAAQLDLHDVVDFVRRSRNVALHKGVFQINVTWRATTKGNGFEVACRSEILLNRYKTWWNSGARRYLKAHSPHLLFSKVVDEYAEASEPLYHWFQDRFYEYHHPKMAEFEELAREYRDLTNALEPGTLPPPNDGPEPHFEAPSEQRASAEAWRRDNPHVHLPPRPKAQPSKRKKAKKRKRRQRHHS